MKTFTVTCPTRADLAGGTLDIWPIYALMEGGKTINVALNLLTRAKFLVGPSKSFRYEIKNSLKPVFIQKKTRLEEIKKFPPAIRFPASLVIQYIQKMETLPTIAIQMAVSSEAPVGSGLGASSALGTAIAKGLSLVFGDKMGGMELMHWIKDAEAAYLKTVTGMQDSLAAIFGNLSCFEFTLGKVSHRTYSQEVFKELSQRLLVLYSGESHNSALSNWEIYQRALTHDKKILKGFVEIKKIVEGVDKELSSQHRNWKNLGRFLNEEWAVRKNIFQVQTKRLDEIRSFLASKKVLGSKVCGAAGGGSVLVLVEPSEKQALANQCEKAGMCVLPTLPFARGLRVS